MSLDVTLENLNTTLQQISDLLRTVEIAILIVAVALSILLIGVLTSFTKDHRCIGQFLTPEFYETVTEHTRDGMTAICYYSKYKKYSILRGEDERSENSYAKSSYHPTKI